jgi:MoxR-like ATPase
MADSPGSKYHYTRLFDPDVLLAARQAEAAAGSATPLSADRSDPYGYVYDNEDLVLAINVALATRRPLLVRGLPGSGKSSLAISIARLQGWRYYQHVITSNTAAQDLLWRFDAVRRLGDAQARRKVSDPTPYIEPGVLWWAIDPASAWRRGASADAAVSDPAVDPDATFTSPRAVVLLDEIDKADPDVPNNLLVPLGSFEFDVDFERLHCHVQAAEASWPLVVITTNAERELPTAFLRRCIPLKLDPPDAARLGKIARRRFKPPLGGPKFEPWYDAIAQIVAPPPAAADGGAPPAPSAPPSAPGTFQRASTAEFLDAVLACLTLNIDPRVDSPEWRKVQADTLAKPAKTVES